MDDRVLLQYGDHCVVLAVAEDEVLDVGVEAAAAAVLVTNRWRACSRSACLRARNRASRSALDEPNSSRNAGNAPPLDAIDATE